MKLILPSLRNNKEAVRLTQDEGPSNPLRSTSLPQHTQIAMWNKVQRCLDDPSLYASAPGTTDNSCLFVKSASSSKPRFVQKSGQSKYRCDSDCLMLKSTNGVCSHTLLLSTLCGETDKFICEYVNPNNL